MSRFSFRTDHDPEKIIVVLEDVGLVFATRNDVGAVLRITLEFEVTNESEVLNGHIARFLDGGCEALLSQGGEFSFIRGTALALVNSVMGSPGNRGLRPLSRCTDRPMNRNR